jgi:hypothetical protein
MAASFLSPVQVASIEVVVARAFATRLALADGGVSLVLARWSVAQNDWIALPAQQVLVTWAEAAQQQATEAATAVNVDGWLEKPVPFDVEIGDLFALGDVGSEMRAHVTLVLPPRLGIQRAAFAVDPEERSA